MLAELAQRAAAEVSERALLVPWELMLVHLEGVLEALLPLEHSAQGTHGLEAGAQAAPSLPSSSRRCRRC